MKHLLTTTVAAALLVGCHVDSIYTGRAERAMFDGVRAGNIQAVTEFLAEGGDVNTQDEPGCTPLHWAVGADFKGSHREMVELLIANGADVNAVDDIQTTPLHMASNKATAKLLIEEGASVDAKNHEGRTSLYAASRNAANAPSQTWNMYLAVVELLIENGAELDTKDKLGETALHVVASSSDEAKASHICELLLTNGAEVNVINNSGDTPLDVAIHKERTKTTDLLRSCGGKTREDVESEAK